MTVNYNIVVANSGPWSLVKIILRWKGSIWKGVWTELVVWLTAFMATSGIYHLMLGEEQQNSFSKTAKHLNAKMEYIPLNFMLGFFVTEVVRRWGIIFSNIGLLDNVSLMTAAHIKGTTEEIRCIRRSIVRYCALSQCLVFRDISMQVRKRFPTLDTVVLGRFMLPHERERFESVQNGFAKYWMPFHWAMTLVNRARNMNACDSDIRASELINEIKNFRTQLATLCNYDWVPMPIMYPQLVFLAVHVYFLLALVGRQSLDKDQFEVILPIMTCVQFVFYMGWLKVADALMNPLGEDDDDLETNFLLDRNLRIGLTIVDEGYSSTPDLARDEFWGTDAQPLYSRASRPVNPLIGSTALFEGPSDGKQIDMVPLSSGVAESYDEVVTKTPLTQRKNASGSLRKREEQSKGTGGGNKVHAIFAPPPGRAERTDDVNVLKIDVPEDDAMEKSNEKDDEKKQ